MNAVAAIPTPIPAFAPVERPDDGVDVLSVEDVDFDVDVEEVSITVAELHNHVHAVGRLPP